MPVWQSDPYHNIINSLKVFLNIDKYPGLITMEKIIFENEFTYKKFMESGKESEFDNLFDSAVKKVKSEFGAKHPLFIGGQEVFSTELLSERSPINGTIIGYFQKGTREHAKAAVAEAKKAFAKWKQTGYKERAKIFLDAAALFSKNKFELAAILSYENAKSRYESMGEVDEAIDFMRYYSVEILSNKGFSRKTKMPQSSVTVSAGFQGAPPDMEKVIIEMKPYGVFGIIAPFNFPISISVGMSVGAMITGNTVVFKPSSTDNMSMLTGYKIYSLLKLAGVPDGVFNYLTGPGSEVGDELVSNPDVSGIAFTGSKGVGLGMISKTYAAGHQKVFVVEIGWKNPAIVSKYANIDDAATGVASAAFGFSGQKCSALSRVYVHESVKDIFISKLIEKTRNMQVGNPLEKRFYTGPLISENAYKVYVDSVEEIKKSGRILYGGERVVSQESGFYVEPTIADLKHDNKLFSKELFVPILLIDTFKTIGEALQKANGTEYGLTAGLYSKNKKEIREFTDGIEAGTIYVNRRISATTGAMVGLHTFVGWKGSGLTGKGTGSKFYLQQFMHEQSISVTQ